MVTQANQNRILSLMYDLLLPLPCNGWCNDRTFSVKIIGYILLLQQRFCAHQSLQAAKSLLLSDEKKENESLTEYAF
jgi:hypothetical protein